MGQLFDSLFGDIYNNGTFHNRYLYPSQPTWKVLLQEDDDLTLEHLWNIYRAYYEEHWPRVMRMRLNLCLYKGINYFGEEVQFRALEGTNPRYIGRSPKITTALVQAMVNQQVTQALLYPSEISVLPVGTNFNNSLQAEAVKELLDAYERIFCENRNKETINRRARIMGEAYRHIYWNRDRGPLDPTYKRRKEAGKTVEIELPNGKRVRCERPVFQGDLDEDILQTWDVGVDNKTSPHNVMFMFHRYLRPVDELRVDYPDMADEIEATTDAYNWSSDMMATIPVKDHVLVVDFYFRTSTYLPHGFFARITPTCIVEQGPNPYPQIQSSTFGNLPYERLTDLDVDGEFHGWSRLNNLAQGQNQYDNVTTAIGRNVHINSDPKWILPKGAANITRLTNRATVVQYTGQVKPELVHQAIVPQDMFTYRQSMKDDMEYVYGSSAIARGEPPPGVTANAALQFLDQQQTEANTLWQVKQDQHTIDVAAKRLSVLSEFFSEEDERVVMIIGEDSRWITKEFDIRTLQNEFKIGLMVSPDFPRRKDARMQTIFQMSQIWPDLFPKEAVAQMFKLGYVNKFLSAAAAAYQAAERENWHSMHGKAIEEPMEFEDLIVHWRTHKRQMQMPEYRMWSEKEQKILYDHQLTTELLMLRKMRKNQVYGAQLQQLGDWPLLLPLPDDFGRQGGPPAGAIPPPPPEQGQGGASRVGDSTVNQQRFPNGQFGVGRQAIQ